MDEVASHEQHQKIIDWLETGSINIFGLPFAGKDTQAQRLSKLLHAPIIGGGDILRNQSGTPDHVLKTIGEGKLAPSEDFIKIMTPYFSQATFSGLPLILSSVGRWHGEEEGIMQALASSNHPLKAVIFIKLDEVTIRERCRSDEKVNERGSRDDDTLERLETRIDEFRKKTLPVINFYRERRILIEVDGSPSPHEITADILKRLEKITLVL